MVGVHGMKNLSCFSISDMELVDQYLFQFCQSDSAFLRRVHSDEIVTDLRSLLVGKRPGHHLHTDPFEFARMTELTKCIAYILVHLGLVLMPVRNPGVVEGPLAAQPL